MASLEERLALSLRSPPERPVEPPLRPGRAPGPRMYRESEGGVLLSLDNASEGEGDILDLGLVLHRHTLQVNSLGDVASGRVELQGSLDAARWHSMAAVNLEGGRNVFFAGSPPASHEPIAFRYIRAVITEEVTGGTVDAYVGA